VVSPGSLSSTPSISATVKTLENTEDEPDDTEPVGYGDIRMGSD
jgi:NaMN:DMB phosphoribosyltransferase